MYSRQRPQPEQRCGDWTRLAVQGVWNAGASPQEYEGVGGVGPFHRFDLGTGVSGTIGLPHPG